MSYQQQTYSKSMAVQQIQQTCGMTSQGWKRLSVFVSICLAASSLAVGAIAALKTGLEPSTLKGLSITGIILNSASITISAITSLDWESRAAQEAKFVQQLLNLVNVHYDGKISLGRKRHV